MKRIMIFAVLVAAGLWVCADPGVAQQGSTTPSLGEYARKLKSERANEGEKAAKVFTNDNIPRAGSLSIAGPAAETAPAGGKTAAGGEKEAAKSGAHDEKYYREAMKELQSQKEIHERELSVLEQKLSQNSTQYYNDPNKTLNQEFTRSDINKKQDEIEKKKQQIADDDKAIANLEAQCQREGCPPGWLR